MLIFDIGIVPIVWCFLFFFFFLHNSKNKFENYLVPYLNLGVHTNAALRSRVVSSSIFDIAACFATCWSSLNLTKIMPFKPYSSSKITSKCATKKQYKSVSMKSWESL
jgi:hypothetical protein